MFPHQVCFSFNALNALKRFKCPRYLRKRVKYALKRFKCALRRV